jgi:hypothetical protein
MLNVDLIIQVRRKHVKQGNVYSNCISAQLPPRTFGPWAVSTP